MTISWVIFQTQAPKEITREAASLEPRLRVAKD
jgi:hypothetical protein